MPHILSAFFRQLTLLACLASLGLFPGVGCHRSGVSTVPVHGKITLAGGPWPRPGVLRFLHVQAAPGMPLRPTLVPFDANGSFRARSYNDIDGLIPGKYQISVDCWEVPPKMDSPVPPKSAVPVKYQSPATSGLEVTVEPNQRNIELNFDIPAGR